MEKLMNLELPWGIKPGSGTATSIVDRNGDMVCICGEQAIANEIVAWSKLGTPTTFAELKEELKNRICGECCNPFPE
jgi:hypothetical protein